MRLHELCKELDADSKRMLALAKELGLGVKSHSSNIPKGAEGILRAAWAEELAEMAEQEAETETKEAEPAVADTHEVSIAITTPKEAEAKKRQKVEDEAAAAAAEAAAAEAAARAAAEAAEPDEPEPVADEPPAEPVVAGDESDESKPLVVTVGGHAVGHEEEEPEPEEVVAEEKTPTETEKPKKKPRRGAKILGRIELKPSDISQPRPRQPTPSQYDPLDPTRPMPARKAGGHEKKSDSRGTGKGGKGARGPGTEYVFDPEDNTALSAIRLGHFGNRRPPMRRPPQRRSNLPSTRKSRPKAERPTHGIAVRPPIAVRDLADMLGTKTREILSYFPSAFDPRDKNAVLEEDHLVELSVSLGREITILARLTEEDKLLAAETQRREELSGERLPRAPVVAVMGHVDHGKTTLLDALRESEVAKGEAGGITQRTSAYLVHSASGAPVCFLDTPGHKAFTEMRARGARITDVAVLVVAADDGVMDQTKEAIEHVQAADVPLVVAINKTDLPGSNPQMVRQQLAASNVMVEGWGGEVGVVECSAVTKQGLDTLVDRLALETEILELAADPKIPGVGTVVDSRKDPDMGVVATVIVMDGTLRPKDAVIAGSAVGRVRYLLDDHGRRIKEAGPGVPVQVFGLEDPPEAGATMLCVEDINLARTVAAERRAEARPDLTPMADAVTLDNLFETIEAQKVTEINVLMKVDSHASLEVVRRSIEEISHPEVRYKVLRAGVGAVTEEDVILAQASKAFIIAFGVSADTNARAALNRTGVELRFYDVIYEMMEEMTKALEGELAPEIQENITGHATIREVFKSSKFGNIAGCYVTDGVITRDSHVRLVRDGKVVYTGRLDSLRRFKDDVKEVKENYECGLHLEKFDDVKQEDVIEAYEVTEVKRTLASGTTG